MTDQTKIPETQMDSKTKQGLITEHLSRKLFKAAISADPSSILFDDVTGRDVAAFVLFNRSHCPQCGAGEYDGDCKMCSLCAHLLGDYSVSFALGEPLQ